MKIIDWKDYFQDSQEHTISGTIKIIEKFPMTPFPCERRIWIYLPPSYDQSTQHYPVIYMHDGQNLFDLLTSYSGEWQVDKNIDRLCHEHKTEGAIIIGIDNGGDTRFDEYIPSYQGDHYVDFIVTTLKPFIDQSFRTLPERETTGTAGSSLGGLISLYLGFKRPDVFSKIGAFSPSMDFAKDSFTGWSKTHDMKIYLDVGTQELLPYNSARHYADLVWGTYYQLILAGFGDEELRLLVDKDATHCEAAWAHRFPRAFLWLFA